MTDKERHLFIQTLLEKLKTMAPPQVKIHLDKNVGEALHVDVGHLSVVAKKEAKWFYTIPFEDGLLVILSIKKGPAYSEWRVSGGLFIRPDGRTEVYQ